jgi:non-specific serine/threonine protein kinase
MNGVAGFGEALRKHRHARRLTQLELAELAGLSERAVSDLERGLKHPQRATVRLLIDALELRPDEAEGLELASRSHLPSSNPTADGRATPNLPSILTTFVGREAAVARLQELLDPLQVVTPPTRLVTLTGAGGSGKTRLALQVARRMAVAFRDGAWFADLSSISDPTLVSTVVLSALGSPQAADATPLQSLLRYLSGRRLLLVLDNCEHLVGACAELVSVLLGADAGLQVLATSREALRAPGEVTWRVPSLEVPEIAGIASPRRVLRYEAAQLFVDRLRQVDVDFVLTDAHAAAVAHICRRLDGIPLALELAAALATAMSVEDIAARLDDRLDLLTAGSRTALPRQQTLRAAIDWSHDRLSESERVLFRRLSVFANGWTLEAAQAVCADDALARPEILRLLMRLIDQSLVSVQVHDSHTRYRLLESVRLYAAERLHAAREAPAVQARYVAWCLDFAERGAAGLQGPEQFVWMRQLTVEHDNLRAVLDACAVDPIATETELRMVAAMARFWLAHQAREARHRLAITLERAAATPSSARAAALTWQAVYELQHGNTVLGHDLALRAGAEARTAGDTRTASRALRVLAWSLDDDDPAERVALLEEALTLARADGGAGHVSNHLAWLAQAVADTGDRERARTLAEEAEELAREGSDSFRRVIPSIGLGWLAVADNRLDDATRYFQTAVDVGTEFGYYRVLGVFGLGQISLRRNDLEKARQQYRQALIDLREMAPGSVYLAEGLPYAASLEYDMGRYERAHRLMGAYERWRAASRSGGGTWEPLMWSGLGRSLVQLPPVSTDPVLIQARIDGRAMSLDAAAAYALELVEADSIVLAARASPSASDPTTAPVLTSREQEVARLLAAGRSNRDIADTLVITEATVEVHVKHILSKLGLRSRSQVAPWAAEQRV